MKNRWRVFVGILVTGAFSVLFLYQVDLREMVRAMSLANFYLVFPAIAAYLVALILRTVRWGLLLSPLGNPKFSKLFWVVVVGYTTNNLLPVRLGEFARAYLLGERFGYSKSAALGTIAVERVGDLLTLLVMGGVAFVLLPSFAVGGVLETHMGVSWQAFALFIAIPIAFGVVLLVVALRCSTRISVLIGWLGGIFRKNLSERATGWFLQFVDGLSILRKPTFLLPIALLSILIWLFEALLYLFLAISFGLHTVFSSSIHFAGVILLTTAISNLATAIPSSQGGIGPFEYFAKQTLVVTGVSAEVASGYVLVVHGTLLVPVTLLGLMHLWNTGLSTTIFHSNRSARSTHDKV